MEFIAANSILWLVLWVIFAIIGILLHLRNRRQMCSGNFPKHLAFPFIFLFISGLSGVMFVISAIAWAITKFA